MKTMESLSGVRTVGLIVVITAAMAISSPANGQNVHGEPYRKRHSLRLNSKSAEEPSWELRPLNNSISCKTIRPYAVIKPVFPRGEAGIQRSQLKHLLWIIPIILGVVGCMYLDRRCPACKKGWGFRNTGNTENRANGRWAWLFPDQYEEYECKYCGYEEWKKSDTGAYG